MQLSLVFQLDLDNLSNNNSIMTYPLPPQTYVIPSRYFAIFENRKVHLSPSHTSLMLHSADGTSVKSIPLDKIGKVEEKGEQLTVEVDNGRKYQIRGKVAQLGWMIRAGKIKKLANSLASEGVVGKPKKVDYSEFFKDSKFDTSVVEDSGNLVSPRPTLNFSRLLSTAKSQENSDDHRIITDFHPLQSSSKIQAKSMESTGQFNKNHGSIEKNQRLNAKSAEIKSYSMRTSFINEKDWRMHPTGGALIFINEEKKGNLGKVAAFVIKKLIMSGSFMGISYPVFAMKPQSMLQTYAKAFGSAPHLLSMKNYAFHSNNHHTKNQKNMNSHSHNPILHSHLQCLKNYVIFLASISVMLVDLDKPFNPLLGQTFQCDRGHFYAQQIVHHPPISSVLFVTDEYRVYGNIQLSASVGLNSANGRFAGDLTLQYNNGEKLVGRIPGGVLSGFIFGDTKFEATGGAYVYDTRRDLVGCYYEKGKSKYQGFIGTLKLKQRIKFMENMQNQERFKHFQPIQQKKYEQIYSSISIDWGKQVCFSQKHYFSFVNSKTMPYIPQKQVSKSKQFPLLLPSDSTFRPDIPLRLQNKIQQSQATKQALEEEQRSWRKLREKRLKDQSNKK